MYLMLVIHSSASSCYCHIEDCLVRIHSISLVGDSNVIVTGVSVGLSSVVSSAVVLTFILGLCGYQKRKKRSLYTPGRSLS